MGRKRETGLTSTPFVVDSDDRDRAALSSYIAGSELKKALAVPLSNADIAAWNAAAAKAAADSKAEEDAAKYATP
jgi:hypothetical protein